MEAISAVQSELELMRHHAKRQLMGTVALGMMAAILAFVGQSALAQVQPLLSGSWGTWQSVYTFVLWALALAWLVALVQQTLHFVNMSERYEAQRRLDAVYHERAVRAQVAEELRQRKIAETEARQRELTDRPRRPNKNARSNKFDY